VEEIFEAQGICIIPKKSNQKNKKNESWFSPPTRPHWD
jgi:hypothetical protein